MLKVIGYKKVPRKRNNKWVMAYYPKYQDFGKSSNYNVGDDLLKQRKIYD